jgi:5'-nucleotidase
MKDTHVLITNDDGIYAEGLQYLSSYLYDKINGLKLSIVAPDRERSAVGHAITMHKPLRVENVKFLHNPALSGFAVNGTPSDCVKLAVEALLENKPDLVVSGINRGSNLGTDVLYSGTVSAAVEGLILGIPSIAVSLTARGEESDYNYAAAFIGNLISALIKSNLKPTTLLNVNVPADTSSVKGVRVTSLGSRRYSNTFEKRTDPRGMFYYWMAGEVVDDDFEDADSDTKAVREKYISVTPIHFQLTDREALPILARIIESTGLQSK